MPKLTSVPQSEPDELSERLDLHAKIAQCEKDLDAHAKAIADARTKLEQWTTNSAILHGRLNTLRELAGLVQKT